MTSPPAVAVAEVIGHLDAALKHAVTHQPRSLQRELGPSEIGCPCDRRLGYRLAGVDPVNPHLPWLAYLGTALHGRLAADLDGRTLPDGARLLAEQPLDVGEVGGRTVTGTSDLYVAGVVVDWKLVGTTSLRRYRAHGPGHQYRVQLHTYGRGYRRRGLPVTHVAIAFLPRTRELVHRHWWHEPYDERIAVEALRRVEAIAAAVAAAGPHVLPLLRTAEAHCLYCPWFRPGSTDLTRACPGTAGLLTPVPI
ncbi:hypothetical protein ACFOWE_24580 [Planomonospora corallina]|uniref:PD-(D/E)XK endonuclease-like domain-containing protein n=1 Tax=Planomonospora corallina TaxID=1806052 RepID=A0ABV8IBZ9_9ACTN